MGMPLVSSAFFSAGIAATIRVSALGEMALAEWLGMTSDTLLAQSAIDRLTSGAHNLTVEGPSHRQRERVVVDETKETSNAR